MGSTTLLRTPSKIVPELEPVQTYAGKTDLVIFAVKPATAVTVVLLTDSLSPVETETVKKGLLALYTALRGRSFRLALLGNGSFGVAGPFTSRAQLKSALSEVTGKTDSTVSAASPDPSASPRLLDNLNASVG